MDWLWVLAALIGVIVSLFGSLLAKRFADRQKESVINARNYLRNAQQEVRNKLVHDLAMSIEDRQTRELILKEFIVHLESSAPTQIAAAQQEEIKKQVEERTEVLKQRLETIEKRFPKESTLEKIASVNDAILGTKVEELQRAIERIESKLLTKWDVAKIVFTIVGALGALIGVALAIIKYATGT